jgi:hypothetical protein
MLWSLARHDQSQDSELVCIWGCSDKVMICGFIIQEKEKNKNMVPGVACVRAVCFLTKKHMRVNLPARN